MNLTKQEAQTIVEMAGEMFMEGLGADGKYELLERIYAEWPDLTPSWWDDAMENISRGSG